MRSSKTHVALADALGHSATDKRIEILRGIGGSGSISQAAREAGVSYKAAWQAVATLTNLAGVPLVTRMVGGAGGGGARLTPQGEQLLQMAQAYDQARRAVAAPAGAVGTAAASLRIRTSMRNQLPGTVQALAASGRRVRVTMGLGEGGAPALAASITQESAELLGLAPGLAAIALCKATAVRVEAAARASAPTPAPARAAGGNLLAGVVQRIARAPEGDEIALLLDGCAQELVGFAAPGVALRRRQRVVARVDASAVVVAIPG